MNQKRINLCFDLDDVKQRTAFNYIQAAGREKTATIVNLVLRDALLLIDTKENDSNKLAQRFERIVKESSSQTDVCEIHDGILQIISQLENIQSSLLQPSYPAESRSGEKQLEKQCTPKATFESEMSEDAFSAMISFFDP